MKTVEKVVNGGYCVGCGVCAAACNKLKMKWIASEGRYFPLFDAALITESENSLFEEICPFSGGSFDEDKIAENIFLKAIKKDKNVGAYLKSYAGFVMEGEFRQNGSSGGTGSWILAELFNKNIVDAVVHVQPSRNKEVLFSYAVSRDLNSIKNGAKSRYYPVELSGIIKMIEENEGRYAIIGLPCFIKAIRLFSEKNNLLKNRIVCHIGLICGHLKSAYFAEFLAWQAGLPPKELAGIDFRHKLFNKPANQYAFEVTNTTGKRLIMPMADIFGGDWGMGFFKFKSCDYCDDVFAETADIVIGDAWLPQYSNDSGGTNIIVARTQCFVDLIEQGRVEGRLSMDEIPIDLALKSQAAGLRHRREGLAHRLAITKRKGDWFPEKRVRPRSWGNIFSRGNIYNARSVIQGKSQEFFRDARASGDLKYFIKKIKPYVKGYEDSYMSFGARVYFKIRAVAKKLLKSGRSEV